MLKSTAAYIAAAKEAFGDRGMSDRELGERLGGYSQAYISKAKKGDMGKPLAMKIADLLGVPRGAVLSIANAERETDSEVRQALLNFLGEMQSYMPKEKSAPLDLVAADGMRHSGIRRRPSVAKHTI